MFGIRFIKVEPTTYLYQYKRGAVVREGAGMGFFYYAPTAVLSLAPLSSVDTPFIFSDITKDFQEITVQGQVAYRIVDPSKITKLLNFTIDPFTQQYVSEDPNLLAERVVNVVNALTRKVMQRMKLIEALRASEQMLEEVQSGLDEAKEIKSLGLEILGLSILSITPNPETGRALEAEAREQLLRDADEAIYSRRNAAVEQERTIKENELNTEIAVENKKREIREAQMDAAMAVERKQRKLQEEKIAGSIAHERSRNELVTIASDNQKIESDSMSYRLQKIMESLEKTDPKILQTLATIGMEPSTLVALAFQGLSERADKIGQLNISPDLLKELIDSSQSKNNG